MFEVKEEEEKEEREREEKTKVRRGGIDLIMKLIRIDY